MIEEPTDTWEYAPGDLFKDGPDWTLNACIGLNGGPYGYDAYALGYFEAARRLAQHVEATRGLMDLVVYPVVFLYRHAIELSLKHLAHKLAALEKVQIGKTHKLLDNWDTVRTKLARRCVDDDRGAIEFVDRVLKDFCKLDPGGENFRFPESKGGVPYLRDRKLLNYGRLAKAMFQVELVLTYWFEVLSTVVQEEGEARTGTFEAMWYGSEC